jgi:predicted nuclease of predicted toxin-antitoxin system
VRFLADESCDVTVVHVLREAGHDVLSISDISPRADDTIVIDLAANESRILLTEDRDFGQLVYASTRTSGGVIYMRYPASAQSTLAQDVVSLVASHRDHLLGHFVVMQPGRTRISRLP